MPAYTSPDNIQYPVSGDQVAPLEPVFANLAQSTQNALTAISGQLQIHTYRWTNAGERTAQTGMQAGDLGFQASDGVTFRYNGTAWKAWSSEWITYTATLTGLNVGNGTQTSAYRYQDGTAWVVGTFVWGSTSSLTSGVTLSHPMTTDALTGGASMNLGTAVFHQPGVRSEMGLIQGINTTSCEVRTQGSSGAVVAPGAVSATAPFTWATGNRILWNYRITPA